MLVDTEKINRLILDIDPNFNINLLYEKIGDDVYDECPCTGRVYHRELNKKTLQELEKN